ncbi:MAG: hypothetical protein Q8N08_07785 [Methanobacteriaceae archaeon]|nr:hypothetical protein [Methanobacteriaceae archaeon]
MSEKEYTLSALQRYIVEVGGWEMLEEEDLNQIREKAKKLDTNEWQKAYSEYHSSPDVIKQIIKDQKRKNNL